MWSLPTKTEKMTRNMAHEPTRAYGQEIFDLVKVFPYKQALEIGSCYGVSALSILLAGTGHLICVDVSDQTLLPQEIEANKLQNRNTFIIQNSHDFFKENKQKFDIVYIDGSHLYDDVKQDLFDGWEALNDDGLMIWDDATHPANLRVDTNGKFAEYGVALASWELLQAKGITHIHMTTRLIYAYKAQQ